MSLRRAAFAGLLYAVLMCTWKYLDDGAGFDQLAIRFAVYFSVFTLGFWFLWNLWARYRGAGAGAGDRSGGGNGAGR